MNKRLADLENHRRFLCASIAEQRGELDQAYIALEKPILYVEKALHLIVVIRRHPWIPLLSLAGGGGFLLFLSKLIFGGRRTSRARLQQSQNSRVPATEKAIGWTSFAVLWGMRLWRAYKFYRRVRPLLQ